MTLSPEKLERLLERAPIHLDSGAIRDRFEGRAAMVVGAGGSIGGVLVELLLRSGARKVVCAESHEPSLYWLGLRLRDRYVDGFRLALADLRDTPRLIRLAREHDVDAIFQMAAYKHVPLAEENADQVVALNVLATLDLADAAGLESVSSFVYPSTDKAVRPPSIYGATKRVVELELLRRGSSVVRLVNVFGTAGNVIERFTRLILDGAPLPVTDPRMTRYWMTLREASELLAIAAATRHAASPLLLDVGEPVPLPRTIERLAALLDRPIPSIEVTGPRPGERLDEELVYPYERLVPTGSVGVLAAESTRALDDLSGTVRRLRDAVGIGDARKVRELLSEAVAAMAVV